MSLDKKDFYGKEVTDAIRKACETLGEAQENLEIEVVETGSTGIFGLIRKKAHIRAAVRPETENGDEESLAIDTLFESSTGSDAPDVVKVEKVDKVDKVDKVEISETETVVDNEKIIETTENTSSEELEKNEKSEELSPENLEIVKNELLKLVELMGFPSTVEADVDGNSVNCTLRGQFEENITGADGKVLDSLQYLLRKIVSRKVQGRVRITVDAGDFRRRRLEQLKVKAVELAALVKEDGKTQVVPALNPSERREIHMVLQEDKEIRSRSVGEGLFKKILIYKPGKGNKPGGRKRSRAKGRNNKPGQPKRQRDS